MEENKKYCSSSFLMYRTIINEGICFSSKYKRNIIKKPINRDKIKSSNNLYNSLKNQMKMICTEKKVALCLSGGIDSAILAKLMPKGSLTYTFKCVVPGIKVVDETEMAKRYAKECGLKNKIIEIYWGDFEKYSSTLMKHKGAPIHSIEVQIYKAALEAKKDGIETLIFGESADCLYGGQSQLFSRNWTFGEFVNRFSYVLPYQVLKEYEMEMKPYEEYTMKDGYIDIVGFMSDIFFSESINSYYNACQTAGIECFLPFANTQLDIPLDLDRIKNGEVKYLIREIFTKLYPTFEIPEKTPMPRPMNEWLKRWNGPTRKEFWTHCTDNMTGDQKWLVWILEQFLNIIEKNI